MNRCRFVLIVFIIPFLLVLLTGPVSSSEIPSTTPGLVIQYSGGGSVYPFIYDMSVRARRHGQIILDGKCYSACTFYLALARMGRFCVTDKAELGFHKASPGLSVNDIPSPYTEVLMYHYPDAIRSWIRFNGGLKKEFLVLKGKELHELLPTCTPRDLWNSKGNDILNKELIYE